MRAITSPGPVGDIIGALKARLNIPDDGERQAEWYERRGSLKTFSIAFTESILYNAQDPNRFLYEAIVRKLSSECRDAKFLYVRMIRDDYNNSLIFQFLLVDSIYDRVGKLEATPSPRPPDRFAELRDLLGKRDLTMEQIRGLTIIAEALDRGGVIPAPPPKEVRRTIPDEIDKYVGGTDLNIHISRRDSKPKKRKIIL